ncbi:helix-turn-helix domain-containing protein [Halobellus litoreus]|uniref:Helix-turn-helix domain-containing protein n=1 Tax=Halobellus litoreus TaxID=755310 RepID=A0ABD6E0I4_9EURY
MRRRQQPTIVSDEDELSTVAGLLEDETVQTILTETSQEPMAAQTLRERCDASGPTIYRRLEQLQACDLIVERTRPDPAEGHHRSVYAPNVRKITITLREGELRLQIERTENMADRFTRLIEDIR